MSSKVPSIAPKRPQGKSRMTQEYWGFLVDAYRLTPGVHAAAAKVSGVDRRTARKAWDQGLDYPWARTPIRKIVEEEQRLARAMLGGEAAAEAGQPSGQPTGQPVVRPVPGGGGDATGEAARNDAAKTLSQEAVMVRVARGNVLSLLAMTTRMLRTVAPLWETWCAEMTKDPTKVPADLMLKIFRSMTLATRDQIQAGSEVMEMERAKLGDPDADMGASMSLEQAAAEIIKANTALAQAKKVGLFSVIDGGKSGEDASTGTDGKP